jgi:hypothetical protein
MDRPDPFKLPRAKIRHPDVIAARERAHAAFDQLWKSGRMTRDAAYAWLCSVMKLPPREAHIGKMHIEQCDKVVRLIQEKLDKSNIPFPGGMHFGTLRAAVLKMEPILKTELIRALLEDADHTTLNALTANGKVVLLGRELDDARAALDDLRAGALNELAELRAEVKRDEAERDELRRRTRRLEMLAAELAKVVDLG